MRMKRKMIQVFAVGALVLSVPFFVSASDIGQATHVKTSIDDQFEEVVVNQKVSDIINADGTRSQIGTATIENQPASFTSNEYGCSSGNHSSKDISDTLETYSDSNEATIVTQKVTKWVCKNCGTQGSDIEAELSLIDK